MLGLLGITIVVVGVIALIEIYTSGTKAILKEVVNSLTASLAVIMLIAVVAELLK